MANDLPSAKDSAISRYDGVVRCIIRGDTNRGKSLIPAARLLLGQVRNSLAQGDIDTGIRNLRLATGEIIHVGFDGFINTIIIDTVAEGGENVDLELEIPLESGYLDLAPLFPRHGPKDAATLYYGGLQQEAVGSYAKDRIYAVDSPIIDAPFLDILRMSTNQDIDIQDYQFECRADINNNSSPSRSTPEIDADQSDSVRTTFIDYLPTYFTGKFKLFFQANCGSFALWENGEVGKGDPKYGINNVSWLLDLFGDRADRTLGIYTHIDHDKNTLAYFLLKVSASGIKYSKLNLSAAAEAAVQIFFRAETDSERDRVEAYILSESIVDSDEVYVSFSSGLIVAGEPFYWGWKGNWLGSEWFIITHELHGSDADHDIPYRVTRHYEAHIDPVFDTDADGIEFIAGLSANMEKLFDGDWYGRVGLDTVWTPNPLLPGMWPSCGTSTIVREEQETPIYGWYRRDGTPYIIKYKSHLKSGEVDWDRYAAATTAITCDARESAQDEYQAPESTVDVGFFSEDIDINTQSSGAYSASKVWNELVASDVVCNSNTDTDRPSVCGPAFGNFDPYYDDECLPWAGSNTYLVYVESGIDYFTQTAGTSTFGNIASSVIIPTMSAEAAYLLNYQDQAISATLSTKIPDVPTLRIAVQVSTGVVHLGGRAAGSYGVTSAPTVLSKRKMLVDVLFKDDKINLVDEDDQIDGLSNTGEAVAWAQSILGSWNELLFPSCYAIDPSFPRTLHINQAVQPEDAFYITDPDLNEAAKDDGYPLQKSGGKGFFVGWA